MYTNKEFQEYLADLLILQYRNEKNFAMIKELAKIFPIEIAQELKEAFDIETAVGKQLDILGKYVFGDSYYGKSRAYEKTVGGVLGQYLLTDDEYRKALLLKIILNNSTLTNAEVDDYLFRAFGLTIRADSTNQMEMTFYITNDVENVFLAMKYSGNMPRPAGVAFNYIIVPKEEHTFGMFTYDELPTPSTYLRTGFCDYSDYTERDGDTLDYSKVQFLN